MSIVTINNVRFDSPEGWDVAYADVRAVQDQVILELLFSGRLEDCSKFVEDNNHQHTSAPTCPTMKFESKTSFGAKPRPAVLREVPVKIHKWGTKLEIEHVGPVTLLPKK